MTARKSKSKADLPRSAPRGTSAGRAAPPPKRSPRAHPGRERAGAAASASAEPPALLSIVILAAGQGTRMRSELPKVLQPLAGAPLLMHVVEVAASVTPEAIHVVYGHGGERVRQVCGGTQAPLGQDSALHWVRQDAQLGTGHALAQALPHIPEAHEVLVLYGDVPLLRADTLRALLELAAGEHIALLTATLPDASGYGRIVRSAGGTLQRIVEESDASAGERRIREINTGVLVAPARELRRYLAQLAPRNAQGEYYLTDIVALARRAGRRIRALAASDPSEVLGINDKLQLAAAEAEYRRRRTRELLQRGVTIIDPARVDIYGAVSVGRDVLLDVNIALQGPVRLGDGVQVGRNCIVRNSSIGERTLLYPNCVVSDADVGTDCRIGPFTHLRPGSRIAANAHLGNFVEIKNSYIGAGSKVNHLSYVGDSEVGSGVNVGAGTITCNYDGVNKWRTRIGDGAFIGSGSMLIAPVAIGERATIGAGSTITVDAPADKLTLARSRQVTIEQWERPKAKGGKP